MVVRFKTTFAISTYHYLHCYFESPLCTRYNYMWQSVSNPAYVLDTTLCDKVCRIPLMYSIQQYVTKCVESRLCTRYNIKWQSVSNPAYVLDTTLSDKVCRIPLMYPIQLYVTKCVESRLCTRYNIMWQSVSVSCGRSVVFFGYSGLLHQ